MDGEKLSDYLEMDEDNNDLTGLIKGFNVMFTLSINWENIVDLSMPAGRHASW